MGSKYRDGLSSQTAYCDEDLSSAVCHCCAAASAADWMGLANGASNPAPMGILQDGDVKGQLCRWKPQGYSFAIVAACDVSGNACEIKLGTYLRTGSDGHLYATGGGDAIMNARSYDTLSTGSGILNVFFFGAAGCAMAAS